MMGKIRQRLEDWMAAAAFAEAGQHETARELLGWPRRKEQVVRKRVRRAARMELRAPGPRT
jgi:hypothetical protein